ncbi:MAG: N-acetyl-alpha-D-glucosaminyl L-malate synthase [Neobacillus sp.]|nr:N-acetyl-alpha-D-glucosaminyl L-malate synthase [Neobacillus sp.]
MLLLSEKESFGLVILEAMACGVPCIGTNVGGMPEVIEHGKTGFLCELGDINDMANKAITLLNDNQLHQQFVKDAEAIVSTKFRADQIVDQYEQIYFRLVKKGD